jgi:predicted nucleic acid-binding Zn ribbon protein
VTPQRRGPRPLGVALEVLRCELAPETLLAEVQRVWHGTVGDAISAEAKPTAQQGGVLTVSCSGSAWAQELDLMAPEIIERVNRLLCRGQVARLRCVVGARREVP